MNTTQQITNEVKEFSVFGKVLTSGMDRNKIKEVLRSIPSVEVNAPRINYVGFAQVTADRRTSLDIREHYNFSFQDEILYRVSYTKNISESPYKSPQCLEREGDY